VSAAAQLPGSLRIMRVEAGTSTVQLDSLPPVPGYFSLKKLNGDSISTLCYAVNYAERTITFSCIPTETVTLSYRVFPVNFSASYRLLADTLPRVDSKAHFSPVKASEQFSSNGILNAPGLNKSGSLMRGISMGNNQDAIVNSSLNLQMNGKLQDNLNIMAVISDNNVPVQPDGYSQQIREFDKVFIKVYNDKHSLQAGDIDLTSPTGYYLKLNRKVEGGLYEGQFNLSNNLKYKVQAGGASSGGKFTRNSITGIEGNQGPYKLKGSQSEAYIIVLAGSEKVFIDGKQLTRGQENDYVIDYNTAELTFTPKQLITGNSRIVVEFEYSDRAYSRFVLYQSNLFESKNATYWLNVYSETDSRNQSYEQTLDNKAKTFLAGIGDNLDKAIYPSSDSVGYSKNLILYAKTDSVVNGSKIEYYRYSTNADSAKYSLSFSLVGQGNGNYILQTTLANGKIYKWIAPVNGIPQGNYEPVGLLATPKKKQVVTAGTQLRLDQNTDLMFETGISNNDQNTFSSLDDNNNVGAAFRSQLTRRFILRDSLWSGSASLAAENVNRNFDPAERYRETEYERDWNISTSDENKTETSISAAINLKYSNLLSNQYQFSMLNREGNYQGFKHNIGVSGQYHKYSIVLNYSRLNSSDSLNTTSFDRLNATLSRNGKKLRLGYTFDLEDNQWNKSGRDSLLATSYAHRQHEWFITNPDSAQFDYKLLYRLRYNYIPLNGNMIENSRASDYSAVVTLFKQSANTLGANLTYRKVEITNLSDTSNQNENTLLARLEHNFQPPKSMFSCNSYIEIGSGLENKKDYSYVQVSKGQGSYKWNDYNNNNLQELNEFELAAFTDEGEYIRVFVPTSNYIKVYSSELSHNFQLQPARVWGNANGLKHFISLFTNQFSFKVGNKNTYSSMVNYINPFMPFVSSDNLVSLNSLIRNNLSYYNPKKSFGIDYVLIQNNIRSLLVNGLDDQNLISNSLKGRYQVSPNLLYNLQTEMSRKKYESGYLQGKNYNIKTLAAETGINWQLGVSNNLNFSARYSNKENTMGLEKSSDYQLSTTLTNAIPNKGSISAGISYNLIKFTGVSSSSVAYEMMQGLTPGNNFTWNTSFSKSLKNGLEVRLVYTGRKTADETTIHNGSVEIRANF
jgi:hypothetical protein